MQIAPVKGTASAPPDCATDVKTADKIASAKTETPFPRIGELPYLLTFAPHGFCWSRLAQP